MSFSSRVSIVIPNYNSAQFLSETLQSAMESSYPNLEIIVVDDGSSDQSLTILEDYKSRYPELIRVFAQCNQGPSVARNYGIHHASGNYILPLDSDDKIHPDYISLAVERFEKEPDTKVVYCEAEKFGIKNVYWNLKAFSPASLALDNLIFVSGLYRKSDWKQCGGYDPRFIFGWEYWDFWINMLKNGGKVVKLPLVGFFYRTRKGSRRKSTNRAGKQMTIQLLNRKHAEFFGRHLGGPLRNPRGLSKFINPILNLLPSIPALSPSLSSFASIKRN